MLSDLRPGWIAKALASVTFYLIGQQEKHSAVLFLRLAAGRVSILAFPKLTPPSKKASVQLLLPLTVTQECPSLPPWMLTVCTCVRDYVISGAAVELYTTADASEVSVQSRTVGVRWTG